MTPPLIAPSLLAGDFSKLGQEVSDLDAAGADWMHLDIMDGHFVPNMTIGPVVIKALRGYSNKPFDTHLMIAPVDPYIEAFAEAGSDVITFHPEATYHPHRTLQTIKALGKKAGVALNPGTPVSLIEPLLGDVDLVLVMTVNPGFGGQSFITSQLEKIRDLRAKLDALGSQAVLQVDGGINDSTAPQVIAAGATSLVAGTAVLKGGPDQYAENIKRLRGL